ncbi:MAG TPA: AraC family transcriptional regulator [Pelotomaculum sp.]|nr:AraC family transcriptional regulator [Pelotomaculum sp.]
MRPKTIAFSDGLPVKVFAGCVEQYPYHWHNTLEIVQVLRGSVNMTLGDDNLLLRENDIAVVNVNELHRITQSQDNEILFIQIDADFYRSLLPDGRYLFIYCCSVYHEAESPEKYKGLKEYIARLVGAFHANARGEHRKNIENILTSMLGYITYNFDFLRWGYGTTEFNEKLVERLLQMAGRASGDHEVKLELKALAAELDISFYHLSHDIKERFGQTFMKLLHYSRCEYAAKLLLSTGRQILDIAMECGFSDPKYLNKHFKHFFKHSPSEFRAIYRADVKTLASQAQYRDLLLSHIKNYFITGNS